MGDAAMGLRAVMGDPGLPLRAGIGIARRDRELDFQGRVLRRQHHMERRSPGKRDVLGAVFGLPEAMVKIVPNGGAMDRTALGNQLGYLSRQGDVPVEDSAVYGGGALDAGGLASVLDGWSSEWRGTPKFGHTGHFVVSFPAGTVPEAAYRAGRAFAEAAFASGDHGDRWDYVSTFHQDTAHPHLHIIVNKRGEDGTWLSTARTSALNTDALRSLQAECARAEGIDMVATPRLMRGLRAPAVTNTEYRRAAREGRAPRAPVPDAAGEAAMVRAVETHAQAYRLMADAYLDINLSVANRLMLAAQALDRGDIVMAEAPVEDPMAGEAPAETTGAATDAKRARMIELIDKADRLAETVETPEARAFVERQVGDLKGEVAGLVPERPDWQVFAAGRSAVYREGDEALARDDRVRQNPELREAAGIVYGDARESIRGAAERIGVDADALNARYAAGDKANRGTAETWVAEELREVLTHRGVDLARADEKAFQAAARDVTELHDTVSREMSRAAQVLRDFAAGRGIDLVDRSDQLEAGRPPDRSAGVHSQQQDEASPGRRAQTEVDRADDDGHAR